MISGFQLLFLQEESCRIQLFDKDYGCPKMSACLNWEDVSSFC